MTITVHKTKSRPVFEITANDNINCFLFTPKSELTNEQNLHLMFDLAASFQDMLDKRICK